MENTNLEMEVQEMDEKIGFITYFSKEHNLNSATEDELARFRAYVDELCMAKVPEALEIKAYACYGGNRAYACDWTESRNLLTELMKVDDNPFIANTLGYIYYYGRCNDGIPEYDKAFYYYSIGAAGGVYESKYKLADMFLNGYGVAKNTGIGEDIIKRLYDENLNYMTKSLFDTKFADIAFRMGKIYEKMEDFKDLAYYFYLQADFAIRMRMMANDYYGDQKVASRITDAMGKILPETKFEKKKKKAVYFSLSDAIDGAYNENFLLALSLKTTKKGKVKATLAMVPREDREYVPKFFMTVPEAHFCGLLETLSFTLDEGAEIRIFGKKYKGEEEIIIFDEVVGDTFCLHGNTVAEIGSMWKLKLNLSDEPETYRFASVGFEAFEGRYECLCEDPEIHEGDWVYLETMGSPKKVCVVKLFEKNETEIPYPIESYNEVYI